MAETSIARASRLAREKRAAKEAEATAAAEAAASADAAEVADEPSDGFFSSFFGRGDAIDKAVQDAQRTNQSTDANN